MSPVSPASVPELKMSAYAGGILISTWSSALGRAHLFRKLPLRLLPLFPPTLPHVLSRLYLLFDRPPALAICGEVGENWKLSAFHLGSFSKSSQWFHLFSRALYTGTMQKKIMTIVRMTIIMIIAQMAEPGSSISSKG